MREAHSPQAVVGGVLVDLVSDGVARRSLPGQHGDLGGGEERPGGGCTWC